MIRINRLKIIVKTDSLNFGFDQAFDKKVNFIGSYDNTKGKSSCIQAIYYSLGLEELIGGRKEKTLTSVFRKQLNFNNNTYNVLETDFYLEIENAQKYPITIYRPANKEGHDANLMTIFFGNIAETLEGKIKSEDMYVHNKDAATSQRGFHRYLEEFIGWELPYVPTYNEADRKLYIQILFSAMFIEQKRGWADLFTTMPNFGIKEPQKRTVEFLIGMETWVNEKKKQELTFKEQSIKNKWKDLHNEVYNDLHRYNSYITGLPTNPEILHENYMDMLALFKRVSQDNSLSINDYLASLNVQLGELKNQKIAVKDNIATLQLELVAKREEEAQLDNLLKTEQEKFQFEKSSLQSLKSSLEIINKDIINNKDVQSVKKLGSVQAFELNKDRCPTCHQDLHDSLLPQDVNFNVMSVEDNIKHLESQKTMLEFAFNSHKKNIETIKENIQIIESNLFSVRRFIRILINDIYSHDDNVSETVAYKKITIQNEIEDLKSLQQIVIEKCYAFQSLSDDWKVYLSEKSQLPKDKFTDHDKECIVALEKHFKNNLRQYGYKSIVDFNSIKISEDKLTPISDKFDLKFDSSASDNIRGIWAYTVALMQTSDECHGNHSKLLIFDEPDQQRVIVSDLKALLNSMANYPSDSQVIIGMTLNDEETRAAVKALDQSKCNVIILDDYAITPLK